MKVKDTTIPPMGMVYGLSTLLIIQSAGIKVVKLSVSSYVRVEAGYLYILLKITFRNFLFRWAPCFTNFSVWPAPVEEDFNPLPLFRCNIKWFDIFTINALLTIIPLIICLPFYHYFLGHNVRSLANVHSIIISLLEMDCRSAPEALTFIPA